MKIPIEKITVSKDNPRQSFEEEGLRSLGESIKEHGQLQSVIVRPRGSGYELVVGERRLRACVLAGLSEIEADVKDVDDVTAMELRLIENIQREDLTDAEKGDGVLALWTLGKYKTIKEMADGIGFRETTMRLWVGKATKVSDKVKTLQSNSIISEDIVSSLVKYPHSIQDKLANAIIKYEIYGGKSGEHPYREFLKLYDQNPKADLEELANKVKGVETVTVSKSEVPSDVLKVIKEIEERKQLAKVKRVQRKRSENITKEKAREHLEKKADFKYVKATVSHGKAGLLPKLKTEVKPTIMPNPKTPDYTLCKCALCPLFAIHCKGRYWA